MVKEVKSCEAEEERKHTEKIGVMGMPIGIIESILVILWLIRYFHKRKQKKKAEKELEHLRPLFEMLKADLDTHRVI